MSYALYALLRDGMADPEKFLEEQAERSPAEVDMAHAQRVAAVLRRLVPTEAERVPGGIELEGNGFTAFVDDCSVGISLPMGQNESDEKHIDALLEVAYEFDYIVFDPQAGTIMDLASDESLG